MTLLYAKKFIFQQISNFLCKMVLNQRRYKLIFFLVHHEHFNIFSFQLHFFPSLFLVENKVFTFLLQIIFLKNNLILAEKNYEICFSQQASKINYIGCKFVISLLLACFFNVGIVQLLFIGQFFLYPRNCLLGKTCGILFVKFFFFCFIKNLYFLSAMTSNTKVKFLQKQPSKGVLRKRCSEYMQQIYRRIPIPKKRY